MIHEITWAITWLDKPYALFYGSCHDSLGGFGDFVDTFDSIESAVKPASDPDAVWEWWHVIDLRTLKAVAGNREGLFVIKDDMKDIKQ